MPKIKVESRKAPVQQRSAATVAFVLEAAARILDEAGLEGYNTNAVAARAGISVGSLYQYFPSKEAITAALIEREHQRLVQGMRLVLVETEGLALEAAIGVLLDMLLGVPAAALKLNHMLETEEARLPRTPELARLELEIERLNRAFLARHVDSARCTEQQLDDAACDTIRIVRAMLDGAAQEGRLDAPDLRMRLQRTVEGYLKPLVAGRG
jgi:AcrR family transcriptional regulator